MSYSVKEIFLTLQGEGVHAGKAAVFCRFSGCNLWSGHEKDRNEAICQFCDTDFVGTDGPGGGKFESAEELADALLEQWVAIDQPVFAVFTGGEPLLQMDEDLIAALHSRKIYIAVETNGTIPLPNGIDWVCVSPKKGSELIVKKGNELKLVYPQMDLDPEQYLDLEFQNFLLQPMDGPSLDSNTQKTVKYIQNNPIWKLSLQTHKYINIP